MLTTNLSSGLRPGQNLEDDAGLEFGFESTMFLHLWIPLSGLYAVDQKLSSFWGPLHSLTNGEISVLQDYADSQGFALLTAYEFIEDVFFFYAYKLSALCIGFNLPFDLSRLAIRQ